MNLLFEMRVGNIVEYSGPVGHFNYVRVLSIEMTNNNRQCFELANPYDNQNNFIGYSEQIRPIFLRQDHLKTLGFDYNTELRQHTLGNLIISSYGYAEGNDPMNLTYVDLGLRILPNGFPNIPTLEQVKNNTIESFYLHSLQNYCSDNNINQIDFTLIK